MFSASAGASGGARSRGARLRQCLVYLNMHPINKPECIVPYAADKIDADGRVTDVKTRETIRHLLEVLIDWTKKLKGLD